MATSVTYEQLATWLDQFSPMLTLFAAQWADSPEDCVQEAFIELARQTVLPNDVRAWLFRVVRNRAISMSRSASRRRRHEQLAAGLAPSLLTASSAPPFDQHELAAALEALPVESREVIVAKIWGQLGFEQIGELIGSSSSTAHRRYEAGLDQLRKILGVSCPTTSTISSRS